MVEGLIMAKRIHEVNLDSRDYVCIKGHCNYYHLCVKDCNYKCDECKNRCCCCIGNCTKCHLPCDNRREDFYNPARFIH